MVTWTIPYVTAYVIWCRYLNYNWPMPFLGYNYILFYAAKPAVMLSSFPRSFRTNKDIQHNFLVYYLYIISAIMFAVLKEGISILFKALPGYLQWIVAFLIPLLKRFEAFLLSRFVKNGRLNK